MDWGAMLTGVFPAVVGVLLGAYIYRRGYVAGQRNAREHASQILEAMLRGVTIQQQQQRSGDPRS